MEILVFHSKSWKMLVLKQTNQDIIKFEIANQSCTLIYLYRPSDGATPFLIPYCNYR